MASRDALERFFELSVDFMGVASPEGRFTRANHGFAPLGYSTEEVCSRTLSELVHPADRERTEAAFGRATPEGPAVRVENRIRAKDGTYREMEWCLSRDADGTAYVIAHDISDDAQDAEILKNAIDEARQTSQFLDAIVENIPDMVFVKDAAQLAFVRMNRAGLRMVGASKAQLLGKTDYDLFPDDEAAFFQEKDRETLAGKTLIDIPEEPIETPSGRRWLHTKKVPLMNERGEPAFLLGISHDITERKEMIEALVRSKKETELAYAELEAFSFSVAHDLRAPLRSMDGFSQAVLEDHADSLRPEGAQHLRFIRESAQHMARLIDDLLALSRVSRSDFRPGPVNLSTLAEKAIARLRVQAPERRVEVVIAPGMTDRGDATLLTTALDNLLGNAWKFTSKTPHARIEFTAEGPPEARTYIVRDNGAGFDMAYANKLFGVFNRLHLAAEFEGTGIGLASVQRIVRRHGGDVWAEGTIGKGACFYFTLRSDEEQSA